jgi:hypothetical protein
MQIMLNSTPESLQDHVDNLDYGNWNTEAYPTYKAVIGGAEFTSIQVGYCQLICDLYEQTSPETTHYFLTEVLGKGSADVKAFINKLYTQFKRPFLNLQEGEDLRDSLFSFCTDIREGRFTTIFGKRPLSQQERDITRNAILFILSGMKDSFVPNPDIRNQFVIFNTIISSRVNNPLLKADLSWQDRNMQMHQALLQVVDNPIENLEGFLALAGCVRAGNFNLNFQTANDGLGNFDFVANTIPDQEIRQAVIDELYDLRTHQNQRNQALIAPLAAAIAPAPLPRGAAHLAAAAHAPDRSCTAKLLFPFRFCYNAVSTLVYNVAHALHIV